MFLCAMKKFTDSGHPRDMNFAIYPSSLTCTPIMPEHSRKYSGNNLLCNVPKTLLGRFLNMVMPATNVVCTTVPNQIENERRWTDAAAWGGRRG